MMRPDATDASENSGAGGGVATPEGGEAPSLERHETRGTTLETIGSARERIDSFRDGTHVFFELPALILGSTGAGFGALARDAEVGFGHTVFMSAILYATPAQVVLVDQLARGAPLYAVAFAVMLTGIRFLPMTVSFMPFLRTPGAPAWQYYLASHFVAITGWTEGMRRLPAKPEDQRLTYFFGFGLALMTALVIGTALGWSLAGRVPSLLTSALLFMTPLYFLLSQFLNARSAVDGWALGLGLLLGPVFFLLAPGIDLLLTGLIGGTLAFLVGRNSAAPVGLTGQRAAADLGRTTGGSG